MKITVELNDNDIRAIYSDLEKFNRFIEVWREVRLVTKTYIEFIHVKEENDES